LSIDSTCNEQPAADEPAGCFFGRQGDDEIGNEPSDDVRVPDRRLIEGQFRWEQQRRTRRWLDFAIAVLREA
jgi:hypothetical protein